MSYVDPIDASDLQQAIELAERQPADHEHSHLICLDIHAAKLFQKLWAHAEEDVISLYAREP